MQFEDGNQKGEHYLCLNCDINYIQNNDISHCYQLPIATLSCTQKSYRWEIWQKKPQFSKSCLPDSVNIQKM